MTKRVFEIGLKLWTHSKGAKTLLGLAILAVLPHIGLDPGSDLYFVLRDLAFGLVGVGLAHKAVRAKKKAGS